MKTNFSGYIYISLTFVVPVILSCQPKKNDEVSANSNYLYVSTGACYSGNNTSFSNTTSSNEVFRLNLDSGVRDLSVADYFASPSSAGDSPAAIANADSENIYVLVENSTTASLRRIERVKKKQDGDRLTVSNNTTAFNAQLRDLKVLSNGDFLISKTSGVEYITAANARIGTPFISPTVAPCASSATLIPKVLTLANGKVVFLHAATGQNRFGIFTTAGGTTCSVSQSPVNAAAFPVAAVYDSANTKLIVAYSGNAATTELNVIYAYTINETTNAVTSAQKIYDSSAYPTTYSYLLYGISSMVLDSANNMIYISTAISTATTVVNYVIEKFRYDSTKIGVDNSNVLTRVGTAPFYNYGTDTRCISSMMIAN